MDPTRRAALQFTTYFCLRRLVFALVITQFSDAIVFQVLVADFAILAMLGFYLCVRPMKDTLNNAVQIFNEVAIILLLQFMFLLSEFTEDPVVRHDYGYIFLYYVLALIIINVLVLITSLVIQGRLAFRRYVYRKRM